MPFVAADGDLKGLVDPFGRVGLFHVAQLVGDQRRQHADVLFVEGKDVGPLDAEPRLVGQWPTALRAAVPGGSAQSPGGP